MTRMRPPTTRDETSAAAFTVVKWGTPAEELMGIALFAHALVEDMATKPERIGIAVPNHNWAMQMRRACERVGLPSTDCLPPACLSGEARAALAKLDVLARPTSSVAHATLARLGHSHDDARRMLEDHGSSCGFTLTHMLGIDDIPPFAHARLHLHGDEDARTLRGVLKTQLAHPTMPDHAHVTPIMHYQSVDRAFDWLLLIGCVNGLVPGPAAFEAPTEQERSRALSACRSGFDAACSLGHGHIMVSYFTKIDAETAGRAHIRIVRCRTEHGRRLAMTAPTSLLDDRGNDRPTTVGGQVLLRAHGLN